MRSNLPEASAMPPPVLPPQPRLSGVNRLLGATAGPAEGNVRSILAIEALTFAHALYALMLVALFMGDAGGLRDFIIATGGALFAFDIGVGNHYFGKRSGEGA